MTNAGVASIEPYQAKDYKSELKPIWCPGCGDFGVVQAIYRALAAVGTAAARDRLRLGHRLLEPDPRLHDGLRLQQRSRPRAADRAGDQARAARAAGAGRRRRRRRLLDRRRPRGARGAPQRRPHLHRDGQPDLRAHQGPALADLAARAAHRVLDVGQPRGPREPAALRARLRRELRGAGDAGRHGRARRRSIEEAIRFPGFAFVNVQSPCVTYGQEEQSLKAHKATMQPLAGLGHDPSDRLKAMALAAEYGTKLYTGVLYRNPAPPPTYESEALWHGSSRRARSRVRAARDPGDVPGAVDSWAWPTRAPPRPCAGESSAPRASTAC